MVSRSSNFSLYHFPQNCAICLLNAHQLMPIKLSLKEQIKNAWKKRKALKNPKTEKEINGFRDYKERTNYYRNAIKQALISNKNNVFEIAICQIIALYCANPPKYKIGNKKSFFCLFACCLLFCH